jgi:hypothetical protein
LKTKLRRGDNPYAALAKDGKTTSRQRIRVRATESGWKLVIGNDGQSVTETMNEQH